MAFYHLSVMVHRQAEKYGEKVALRYRDYDRSQWVPVTWNEFSQTVSRVSDALLSLGVGVQENIGVFSQNKPECLYVNFGAYGIRAVVVPLYATSSPAQVQYIINDARIRFLFVGEQYQYDAAFSVISVCDSIERIIIFDRAVCRDPRDCSSIYFDEFIGKQVDELTSKQVNELTSGRVDELTSKQVDENLSTRLLVNSSTISSPFGGVEGASDIADILYTSGTTGDPKGVMLMHYNYMEAFRTHEIRIPWLNDRDVSMDFLPLTHVFERGWTYVCLQRGTEVCINLRPQDIQTTIREIRPTVMCSVPRFWEKVYQAVQERIEKETGMKKAMMLDAIRVGREHNLEYVRHGKTPPMMLHLKYKFYEKTVQALLKKTIGIENGRIFPTAGAFVSDEVCEFAHSVGIPMIVGYGLTESTATVSCFKGKDYIIGSVGEIMPDLEVKIGEKDEILLRGKTITPAYYKKAEATAEAIDKEGWFHTGDAGRLEGNTLYLTDRIKDLFKTSNGKYVCPQALETRFIIDRYIDQVAIIADNHKFVSALIVPVYNLLEEYAAEKNLIYDGREELLSHPKIQALYRARIDTLQQPFAHFEQVKRFTLLPRPFSMERGELTNTLKLKRAVIAENYKEVIEKMYEE